MDANLLPQKIRPSCDDGNFGNAVTASMPIVLFNDDFAATYLSRRKARTGCIPFSVVGSAMCAGWGCFSFDELVSSEDFIDHEQLRLSSTCAILECVQWWQRQAPFALMSGQLRAFV